MALLRFLAVAALFGSLLAGAAAGAAEGPVTTTEHVEARLVAEARSVAPGETVLLGLHKIIVPHWHTYWRNPGDAGEPTTVDITSPAGVTAGDIVWPLPESIDVGGGVLRNYGYEGEVLLPFEVTVPADAAPGETLTLAAHAYWLVCENICVPEDADLTIDLPVAAAGEPDARWGSTLEEAVAAAPKALGWQAGIERAGDKVRVTVADPILAQAVAAHAIRNVELFPFDGDVIVAAADQVVRFGENGVDLTLTPNFGLEDSLKPIPGVLAFEEMRDGEWARRGVEILAQVQPVDIGAIVAAPRSSGGGGTGGVSGLGLLGAILFAFVGGLILNLMPCVFPVLSIKALGVIGHAHGERAIARRHGAAFLAGVLVTFAVLAGVLIALQAAGSQLGWGFQLQSPAFVTVVAVLFFAIGLNLLGLFELGGSFQNFGNGATALAGPVGSFATGALAVVAASPCTAPFMSTALPVALASPPPQALAIFLALGLGFAAPFTLLSFYPGWAKVLPKPGVWMERLKQLLAFPMFAAAVWLLWVLASQAGPNGMLAALSLMGAVAFLVWSFHTTREARAHVQSAFRIAGLAALAVVLSLVAVGYKSGVLHATTEAAAGPSVTGRIQVSDDEVWSAERVAELRAEGKPVFVDFTAAWCITCQVNKLTTLETDKVQRAFADAGVVQLVADWTNRDAAIAQELDRYERSGVPLYLLFPPRGEAIVLNEILTEKHVLDAVARLKGTS